LPALRGYDDVTLELAVSHLTRCLAVEWGEHRITVNAVAQARLSGHARKSR
jgi:NAD(P)-dependent dehydrogenase (short-subunit alcohol dehydrogenase family)